jgi:hypothetical protein
MRDETIPDRTVAVLRIGFFCNNPSADSNAYRQWLHKGQRAAGDRVPNMGNLGRANAIQ